jgi:hypothetical protein
MVGLSGASPRPQTPDPRPQTPEPSTQTPDPRPQTPDPRPQTLGPRPQAPLFKWMYRRRGSSHLELGGEDGKVVGRANRFFAGLARSRESGLVRRTHRPPVPRHQTSVLAHPRVDQQYGARHQPRLFRDKPESQRFFGTRRTSTESFRLAFVRRTSKQHKHSAVNKLDPHPHRSRNTRNVREQDPQPARGRDGAVTTEQPSPERNT